MQLSSISEFVLSNLLSGEKVSNEIILELIAEVIECIKNCSFQKIPPSFYRLSEYVVSKVQFENLNELSTDIVLMYGKLWAIMYQAEIAEQKEAVRASIDDDAKQFENRHELFRAIRDRSGISHSELAEATGLSVSSLSQFMGKIDNGKYFISHQVGRKKYYYITNNGRELVNKMEERLSVTEISQYRAEFLYVNPSFEQQRDK